MLSSFCEQKRQRQGGGRLHGKIVHNLAGLCCMVQNFNLYTDRF